MTRALVTKMLRALDASRDDVNECLNEVLPKAGSYRYDRVIDSLTTKLTKHDAAITAARDYLATEPSGERAELIRSLRTLRMYAQSPHGIKLLTKAADMLEADVSLINEGNKAQQAKLRAQLEQEWVEVRAIRDAYKSVTQQAKQVPMTDDQIEDLREKTFSTGNPYCPVGSKSMRKAARAIEAHHGIGGEA